MRLPAVRRSSADPRGFSLIEVLVALAIVGLALGAAAAVFGNGLAGHEVASDVDTALAAAEEKLAGAGIAEALHPGHAEGVFADRYDWRVAVMPYEDKATADAPPSGFRLFRIEATVRWREGLRHRQVTLETLRLAREPPP